MTALEAAENGLVPLPFAAWTLNVYERPGVEAADPHATSPAGCPSRSSAPARVEPMNGVTM